MGYMKDLLITIYRGGDEAVEAAKKLSPSWIPVSERLPQDGESVIVFWRKYKEVGEAVFGKADGWFSTDRGGCYDVSHWMPLPEPPET